MASLEIRRHTMRTKPGQHISKSGISLANLIGKSCSSFDLVVTSEIPRAIETAIAMGFAVDCQITELGILPESIYSAIEWPKSLKTLSETTKSNGLCNRYAKAQASHWNSVLDKLSDHQSGLIVTHGGIIELGAIGFMPNTNHALWGGAIGYCEGFKFTRDQGGIECEVLRVPSEFQQILN